jgi:hypothetical protein
MAERVEPTTPYTRIHTEILQRYQRCLWDFGPTNLFHQQYQWLAQTRAPRRAFGALRRAPLIGSPFRGFVTDEQQRLLKIEEMRLVVKFGDKKRYSDCECEAIYQELVEAGLDDEAWDDLDTIEAVFRKLNAVDEAETARRDLCG